MAKDNIKKDCKIHDSGAGKLLIHGKILFKKNQQQQLCKEWFAHAIARTARADENDNYTRFFSLLSVSKFQSFILNLRHKTR